MMYVLKGLALIGIILCAFLMFKKTKEMAASDEKDPVTGMTGKELIAFGKKKAVFTAIVGFIANFLDTLGIGSYAPCMAMVLALGMDAGCAFPAMMGSCAFLMAFGNGPKFIKEGKFDPICSWTQAIGGAVGVFVAYLFVSTIPLELLTKVIVVIVYITAFLYLKDAIKKGSAA